MSAADVEKQGRQRHRHQPTSRTSPTATWSSRRAWRTARSRPSSTAALGAGMKTDGLVASNSSSMGPGLLGGDFAAGGGDRRNFLNLHFFSPAEHPMMQLVEIIAAQGDLARRGRHRARLRAQHQQDAGHPAGRLARLPGQRRPRRLHARGRDASTARARRSPAIDEAMRETIFPMGPFELGDQAGLDIAAGMFDTIAAAEHAAVRAAGVEAARAEALRHQERRRRATTTRTARRQGEWPGLAALVPRARQPRRRAPTRSSSAAPGRSTPRRASSCDRKIVASEEECDLAFVFGIGFAMYLGGPIFYGKQRGWDKR